MKETKRNTMAQAPMKRLFWKMGLPMIVSMVLQALYNVVDSIFVTNMGAEGAIANQALTIAFPIQILMIAIGVGTGVGLNAMLSKSLGEENREQASRVAGNGIFLTGCIYACFLVFGLFGAKPFIQLFAAGNANVIAMGTLYLQICCILSLGAIGYTVYERFLQATGKTLLSTIAQISGAVVNIVLDYIFIFPCQMGVAGAAWATVIGQFVSLFVAMFFHYTKNREIDGHLYFIQPNRNIICGIYEIGISAALMQTLLAVMMAGMNAILGNAKANPTVLVGSFGIYYKIQQIALFSAFGLSNTIITILSFNYGMKDQKRMKDCMKYGLVDTLLVTFLLTVLFEICAKPLANLFGLAGGTTTEMIAVCVTALRISCLGYVFMGCSIAIQGMLQALRYALRPLFIALLRLVVLVFPVAYAFSKTDNVINLVWWTFPIAEFFTACISLFIWKKSYQERVATLEPQKTSQHFILSISREHGSKGKEIARRVAEQLQLKFYDKEELKEYAVTHGMISPLYTEDEIYQTYLSLQVQKEGIAKQTEVIQSIAQEESFVIVGRASDYILRNHPHLVKIFLYAPLETRIQNVMEMYQDTYEEAMDSIEKSDHARAEYYEIIANQPWGKKENYDLCLNVEIGISEAVDMICSYVSQKLCYTYSNEK